MLTYRLPDDYFSRYVASINAFIAVSDANADVFFYKNTAGRGAPAAAAKKP